jgi:protein-glucosylgalactosylhydroxylysine glucosidase
MWDVEAFAVPALQLTQPDAAAAILDYRWRSLPAARHNAQMWGFDGAQFPWESSPLDGVEATPRDASGAMYEHHVSADVAHAFAMYARATNDRRFLAERAWAVVADVAQWVTSRVTRTDKGFEIREALGVAEDQQPADSSAFVVMSAAVALDDAIEIADQLGREVPDRWRRVRAELVLAVDDNGVILDHEGYRADGAAEPTPAALAGLFPFDFPAPDRVQKATRQFYLGLADRYIGKPMLSPLYGTWAAQLGDRALSAALFEDGFAALVSPRLHNIHEYRQDRFPEQTVAGPFTANIGAFLTGCLYGLTGMRPSFGPVEQWVRHPASMPSTWEGVEVERLWVHGEPMHLLARHGQHPELMPT